MTFKCIRLCDIFYQKRLTLTLILEKKRPSYDGLFKNFHVSLKTYKLFYFVTITSNIRNIIENI